MIRNHTLSSPFIINEATPGPMEHTERVRSQRERGRKEIYMQHVCVTFNTRDLTLQENDSLVVV